MSGRVVWSSAERRKARRVRQRSRGQHDSTRRWRVDYRLVYDSSSTEFTLYYLTRAGAFWSAFIHRFVRSWGGDVTVYDQHADCSR